MQNRIKQLREKLGLSQIEFAKRIGVTNQTVSLWENGKVPLLENSRYRIEREFNVNRQWLETGEGEMMETPENPIDALNNVNLLVELAKRSIDCLDDQTRATIVSFVTELSKKLSND